MAENAAVRDGSKALRPRGDSPLPLSPAVSSVLSPSLLPVMHLILPPPGAAQPVFVAGSDASHFFKRRGRRSGRYHAELLGMSPVDL